MTDYSIIPGERSGFAIRITETGADGHIVEGFVTRFSAEAWLKGRHEAEIWMNDRHQWLAIPSDGVMR